MVIQVDNTSFYTFPANGTFTPPRKHNHSVTKLPPREVFLFFLKKGTPIVRARPAQTKPFGDRKLHWCIQDNAGQIASLQALCPICSHVDAVLQCLQALE
jgi:hypothetical protein